MENSLHSDSEHYEYLRQLLISGKITAITFDTQVFDRNGRTFRGGLLGQLGQLKDFNIGVVIAELIYDETNKHMLEMHRAKALKTEEAVSNLKQYLSDELLNDIQEEINTKMSPENIVFHEMNDFFLATDAEIISYEETSARNLFNLYFMSEPPFHKKNSKKHEFPDAIALLCLEEYSKNNGILVVSEDNDWVTFCSESKGKNLHCVPDLGIALSLINSVKNKIKEIIDGRFNRIIELNNNGTLQSLIKENAVADLKNFVAFSGRSTRFYNAHCLGVDIIAIKPSKDKNFGKIRDDSNITIWILEMDLECRIRSSVTFTSDGENYLGSSKYEITTIIPSINIIKITNENVSVETVINKTTVLDLGAIEPDENKIEL